MTDDPALSPESAEGGDARQRERAFFGQATASATHEINNVLAIINEYAGLLGDLAAGAEAGRPLDPARLTKTAGSILRQIKRGVTGVLLWGDGHPLNPKRTKMGGQDWRYWADFAGPKCYDAYPGEGNPHRGKKTAADLYGYIDGPANKPGSSYMGVSLGGFRAVAAVMILMPQVRSVVNTDAPIEYTDRVTRHGLWTWPDPVAPPAQVDQETARLWWSATDVKEWQKT